MLTMILAILQARVSSTRLPGKVLKPILGVPMILRQIERIQRAESIDKLIVATSMEQSDDELVDLCEQYGIECARGSLNDVLDRFYQVAARYKPDHIVRLTGDCPLTDPKIIDEVIQKHLTGHYDYTSNTIEPTYPDGLDVEIFRLSCLERAWQEANIPSQREHVTLFFYQHPELFYIGSVKNTMDLSKLRWTVDELEDFLVVNTIYEQLYPHNSAFSTKDILDYLNNHDNVGDINSRFTRNEGLIKSLEEDRINQ